MRFTGFSIRSDKRKHPPANGGGMYFNAKKQGKIS